MSKKVQFDNIHPILDKEHTDIFKAITVSDLNKLSPDQVYLEIKDRLKLIN